SRQHIVNVLADTATRLGVAIQAESPVAGADPAGVLLLADGSRLAADLLIGADGVHSVVRDSLGLVAERRQLGDGATRTLVSRTPEDVAEDVTLGPMTCEYWAGTRRVITSPCSSRDLYVVMSCLADDVSGRAIPADVASWSASFPHLETLFERIAREADPARIRWTAFETVRLRRWYAGRVAVLGDAAHAMPPNLGQGSGCAMMNALAIAAALDDHDDVEHALAAWERRERPLTEHTQKWSMLYGQVTTWPEWGRSLAFNVLGGIGWVRRQYQRTANHIPTGCRADSSPAQGATS
ncbi:MAG TPA: NAD(P)/FAD-dependent oxidoreductase, partial [Casimicrobiaceae bacterium]|nr:NAD(P)/FAD-dependent oxidoreductase [Casimicrobiaceae bacterium]